MGACCVTGRASPQTPDRSHTVPPPEARTDINTATMDQLLRVPGMTRTWAARIIRFRPYRTKNDLIDRGVLTNEVYNRVKDYIIAHRTK
jgi:DNA uptake protein ComE-like DNA-binding protein